MDFFVFSSLETIDLLRYFSPFCAFCGCPSGSAFFFFGRKIAKKQHKQNGPRHPIVKKGLSNLFFCQKRLSPSGNIVTTMKWINPKSLVCHLQQHCHRHSHLHPGKLFAIRASRFQTPSLAMAMQSKGEFASKF